MAVLPNQRVYVRRPGSLTPSYGLFKVVRAMGTFSDALPTHARQGVVWSTRATSAGCLTCFETNCIDTARHQDCRRPDHHGHRRPVHHADHPGPCAGRPHPGAGSPVPG